MESEQTRALGQYPRDLTWVRTQRWAAIASLGVTTAAAIGAIWMPWMGIVLYVGTLATVAVAGAGERWALRCREVHGLVALAQFADAARVLDTELPRMHPRDRDRALVMRARVAAEMGEFRLAAAVIARVRTTFAAKNLVAEFFGGNNTRADAKRVMFFNFDRITPSTCWFESIVYRLGHEDLARIESDVDPARDTVCAPYAELAGRAVRAVVRGDRAALIDVLVQASQKAHLVFGLAPSPCERSPYVELLADRIAARSTAARLEGR